MAESLNAEALKAAVRYGQILSDPKQAGPHGQHFAVIPNDSKVEDLSRFLYNQYSPAPHRKIALVKVLDAPSFIEYWAQFADDNSRAFADETCGKVLGVLDYHAAKEGSPRWGQHKVQLDLRDSEEWKTWKGSNGKKMNQADFAEFIEDNTPDVATPPAAVMLEMAREMQAKTDISFSSAIRTASGAVQLKYTENIKGTYGTGNVEIPEEFSIAVPVYCGTPRVRVPARLRYRLPGGNLSIWYNLLRPDAVEREAFRLVLEDICNGIGSTVIRGWPGEAR